MADDILISALAINMTISDLEKFTLGGYTDLIKSYNETHSNKEDKPKDTIRKATPDEIANF